MNNSYAENSEIKLPISFDTLLLGALVVSYFTFNQVVSALLVLAVVIYALVDLLLQSNLKSRDVRDERREKLAYTIKFFLLFLIIGIAVIGRTAFYIATRANGEPDEHLHDGAFQTEVALRYLVNGRNPYAENYLGTGLESYVLVDAPKNPALYNFVYFPFLLYISLPFYWFSMNWFHWYDQRLIYLSSFLAILFLLTRLTMDPAKKLILLILLALNFYSSSSLEQGFNDWIVFAFLIGMILFLKEGRLTLASLMLGIACASKPSAWFVLPFFALFVLGNFSWQSNYQLWTKKIALVWIVPLATILPFLIWNAGEFYRNTIGYTLGLEGTVPYPIRGFGIGTWLLAFGIVPSPLSLFPFWILEILIGAPVLIVLLLYQQRHNTINIMLFCFAGFFLTVVFFSRFFQGNYLLFGLLVALTAWFADPFRFRPHPDSVGDLSSR